MRTLQLLLEMFISQISHSFVISTMAVLVFIKIQQAEKYHSLAGEFLLKLCLHLQLTSDFRIIQMDQRYSSIPMEQHWFKHQTLTCIQLFPKMLQASYLELRIQLLVKLEFISGMALFYSSGSMELMSG
jgi:hypothetical protein